MLRDKYSRILYLDYETRSELDVQTVGTHRYAMHHSTEVTLISYAFDDEEAVTTQEVPGEVLAAIESSDVLKVAHNAEFDMAISKYVLGMDVTFTDWYDTAYLAAYTGRPRKLAHLARVLNTQSKGAPEDMLYFSKPLTDKRKKVIEPIRYNEMRNEIPFRSAFVLRTNEDRWKIDEYATEKHLRDLYLQLSVLKKENENVIKPNPVLSSLLLEYETTIKFKLYAVSDVIVMRECMAKMASMPEIEIFVMQATFKMNFNGVPFDTKLAMQIKLLADKYANDAGERALAEYGVENLRSVKQVKAALFREGTFLASLNKKERGETSHPLLELRDQATGSAFSKIITAFERICPDSRLRGEFVGFGAHTGRWSSRGVQLQNFARGDGSTSTDLSKVESYDHLRKHLRLCIHGAGKSFTCADLSQIEARVTAWLADCEWRMNAFKNNEDIYARSAEIMFNIPRVTKGMPERQMGKCAELGLGFGGGPNAIQRVAPDFYREQGEEKVVEIVQKWRAANPEICQLWRSLERAFKEAMRKSVCRMTVARYESLVFKSDGITVTITLPSGRCLYYPSTHVAELGKLYYLDYSRGGETPIHTQFWGGTLTENIVQAIARDIIVDIMRRIDKKYGYKCIGTVHDEVWYLSDNGEETYNNLIKEMNIAPSWAPRLVVTGDGFTSDRYIK